MIKIISVMSELGAGTRGASLGYEAMRIASLQSDPSFFKQNGPLQVKTENNLLHNPIKNTTAKRISGIKKMYQRIGKVTSSILEHGQFPLIISGDHSNAGGTISGISKAFPDKTLGVVWVDAHADIHSPYTSPSGNMHGMPLATALSVDNKENQVVTPSEEVSKLWKKLKGKKPRLLPENLVFMGVRDTETPEDNIVAALGIPNFTVDSCREKGLSRVLSEIDEKLSNCDIVYVSFDVDSMDPSISEGTGTPVKNGFSVEEAQEILTHFAIHPKTRVMEFTEVNPLLDTKGNKMGEVAFSLFKSTYETLNKRLQ